MGNNGFREDELVLRKQKVNGEWVETYFPKVGGRLRLAHDRNEKLTIQTEVFRFDDELAVVKATATTEKGSFCGYGSATAQRDQRLADSLLELAETRSIARALRFSGYGVEFTGAEEVSHVTEAESNEKGRGAKEKEPVFPDEDSNEEGKSKAVRKANGNASEPKATQAQVRALYALTKRAGFTEEDVNNMLDPLNARGFDDLTRENASRLITDLQTQAA
jgi:hypothetical protein